MTICLPRGSVRTSALGMGCARLSAGWSRTGSIRLVHAAFAAGIRHFDVAPPYGMGTAEDVLGRALEGRRYRVSIATKVGLARPQHGRKIMLARNLAAPLRRLAPQMTGRIGSSAYRGLRSRPKLTPAFIEASLTVSLRLLRTEYLDLLLLHEVAPEDLTDEVIGLLERLRSQGKVLNLGTGTSWENTLAIRKNHAAHFDVWQFSWSVLDNGKDKVPDFNITHGSIRNALPVMRQWLKSEPWRLQQISELTGANLELDDQLGQVLLGAAMAHNPKGITLVSSRKEEQLRANAGLLNDLTFRQAGEHLMTAASTRSEMVCL